MTAPSLIGIREVAAELNRTPATLRHWEREKLLPESLRPQRNARGWRCWSPEQVQGIKDWIAETERHPGKGIRAALHARGIDVPPASAEEQERILAGQRRPRKVASVAAEAA